MDQIARMFGVTRNNKLGFTLIELLVVIAIIGLLAGVSIPIFLGQRTKAIISEARSNLTLLFTLEEQYYAEHGRYAPWPNKSNPLSVGNVVYKGTHGVNDKGCEDDFPSFKPGPINKIYFDYWCLSAGNGTLFQVAAVGKASKPSKGIIIILNSRNEWEKLFP